MCLTCESLAGRCRPDIATIRLHPQVGESSVAPRRSPGLPVTTRHPPHGSRGPRDPRRFGHPEGGTASPRRTRAAAVVARGEGGRA